MKTIKTIHKWLSLLVGIQLLIWLGTGLYFNLMDGKKASGNQYRQPIKVVENININKLIDPKTILQQYSKQDVINIKLMSLLSKPYYLLTHQQGLYPHFQKQQSLLDAYSGEKVVVTREIATDLATASYSGSGNVAQVRLLSPPIKDIPKEQNQVWQVNFNDEVFTSVYIDASSGRLIAHSNDNKRFANFFFMLHFMDYTQEGSFNNIQIIIFALFSLFFALTGFIWTIELITKGQYQFLAFKKHHTNAIQLLDKRGKNIGTVTLDDNKNILDSLAEQGINLPTICGGGGSCASCKIIVETSIPATSAEQQCFTQDKLKQGYRLACQHNSALIDKITLLNVNKIKQQSHFFKQE
jgi:ferredoxin